MKKKILLYIILAVCIICFVVSGFLIFQYYAERAKAAAAFTQLTDTLTEAQESIAAENPHLSEEELRLLAYQSLYEKNNDLVGWITIPNTRIDYPVMQSSIANPEYYLRTDFNKQYSVPGTPFLDSNASLDPRSDNLIIYGHHMHDGSMFADLTKYLSKSFYDENPTFRFDTLTSTEEYQIVSVFTTNIDENDPNMFAYYNMINAGSPEAFDSYVATAKTVSVYNTGVDVSYGDKLITLSTCEYTHEDGRLVVIAKQINSAAL